MEKEILEKIMDKAGLDFRFLGFDCNKSEEELLIFNCIFSHEFAKAFWGEEPNGQVSEDGLEGFWILSNEPIWKQYLQQMVLKEEPLKYLEKFLN